MKRLKVSGTALLLARCKLGAAALVVTLRTLVNVAPFSPQLLEFHDSWITKLFASKVVCSLCGRTTP